MIERLLTGIKMWFECPNTKQRVGVGNEDWTIDLVMDEGLPLRVIKIKCLCGDEHLFDGGGRER